MDGELVLTGQEVGYAAAAIALIAGAFGVFASGHALLNKRRPRSAFAWIAVCLTFPLAGALLYFFFGINRTRRRAQRLRHEEHARPGSGSHAAAAAPASLARMGEALANQPLLEANVVEALHNGEQAYPAMLEAIDAARHRVYLSTYIFDSDDSGHEFADALQRAVQRGVDVRVLIDGVGEQYSLPRARWTLEKRGVKVLRYLPPRLLPPSFMLNLRNHRKVLVVDDQVAFSGGMNVSDRHLAARSDNPRRVVDVHFRLRGPVVISLADVFLNDWVFAGGEAAEAGKPAPTAGTSRCRVITDGPDEELDRLLLLCVGVIGLARRRVAIMTPYFIPPRELIGALQAAALRGVDVSVLLPANNNLFFMHRATRHQLWELLQRGVRIYFQPGPFVHSKLLLVDDDYVQLGSANLDPRSLRLNFELVVEVFDDGLAGELSHHHDCARRAAREVTLAEVDGRRLGTRLVDGVAWLFSPYL